MDLVLEVLPHQVTLVPDAHDAITSNSGWDTQAHFHFLQDITSTLTGKGIRTSIFVGTNPKDIEYAAKIGANRVELYTEPYASQYPKNREDAIRAFLQAAQVARENGLEVNAGHDLNLENLSYFHQTIPWVMEVSIGHALIADALYLGLEATIQAYLKCLK